MLFNLFDQIITKAAAVLSSQSKFFIISEDEIIFCMYSLHINYSTDLKLTCTSEVETSSDLILAQMLQMEFDREFDTQLRREEKKFNGDSKGITMKTYIWVQQLYEQEKMLRQ